MATSRHQKVLRVVLAALFLALAYVLPFATGQIPRIGNLLCPMHLAPFRMHTLITLETADS